jgi:hypothetical protein
MRRGMNLEELGFQLNLRLVIIFSNLFSIFRFALLLDGCMQALETSLKSGSLVAFLVLFLYFQNGPSMNCVIHTISYVDLD